MIEKKLDSIVRKKLNEHESDVPANMWSRIQGDIKNKRKLPIAPILVLFAILSVGAILYVNKDRLDVQTAAVELETGNEKPTDTNSTYENESTGNSSNISTDEPESSSKLNSSDQNENAKIQKQITKSENIAKNYARDSKDNSSKSQSVYNQSHNINKRSISNIKNTESATTKEDNYSIHSASSIENNSISSRETSQKNLASDVTSDKGGKSKNEGTPASAVQNSVMSNSAQDIHDSRAGNNINIEVSNSLTGNANENSRHKSEPILPLNEESASTSEFVRPLSISGGRGLNHGHFVYDPCSVKGGKRKNRLHCYTYVEQEYKVFADFSAGPQYSHKMLELRNNDFQPVLNAREDNESFMFSYNANARIGVKLANGLTGMAGISYDRYNERFDYFNPNEQLPIETIVIVVEGMDSVVNVSIDAIGNHTVKHTNTLSFISIPLTVGYSILGEKVNLGIHGGVAVNLLFAKSGRIVNENGLQTLSGPVKKETFRTNAGLSLMGGIVLEYKIDRELAFFVEPRFNYTLSSLTSKDYPIEQKYVNAGLNFGLRKTLYQKTTHKKKYGIN